MTTPAVPYAGERTTLTWGGTLIGEVLHIDPPELKTVKVEKTVLGDAVKSHRAGKAVDGGSAKFTLLYDKTAHAAFHTAITAAAETACILIFYDGAGTVAETWTWAKAVGESFKLTGAEQDKNIEAEVGVWFNDLPVIT
jgi:hypothetical protein